MSEQPSAPSTPQVLDLPPVPPLGGSKWASCFPGPTRATLASFQWRLVSNAVIHPDGRVTADDPALPKDEAAVFALPAGPAITLGRFLTGPLAAACEADRHATFCGAPLSPRQTDVLAKLGFLRGYITLNAPRRFAEVSTATPTPGAPGRFVQKLADALRAPPTGAPTLLAILPRREAEKFCLTNRASLTAWLRAKQVTVIDPETTRLAELLSLLAGASLVILADPAQSGLLGLCPPGTRILEIAPEGWLGVEARVMAHLFGLDWRAFLAAPPSYRLQGALPFGSLVPCSYEVPIRDLAKVLEK